MSKIRCGKFLYLCGNFRFKLAYKGHKIRSLFWMSSWTWTFVLENAFHSHTVKSRYENTTNTMKIACWKCQKLFCPTDRLNRKSLFIIKRNSISFKENFSRNGKTFNAMKNFHLATKNWQQTKFFIFKFGFSRSSIK